MTPLLMAAISQTSSILFPLYFLIADGIIQFCSRENIDHREGHSAYTPPPPPPP